ncbi:MAG: hypothetical protein ACYC7E_02200 [Armatimonadota bacterium]
MRIHHYLIAILLCGMVLPSFAAETVESLTKRVMELEKSNLVLLEDLGNTRLELVKVRNDLTAETKARTELAAALDAAKKDLSDRLAVETAARLALDKKTADADAALTTKIDEVNKALIAQGLKIDQAVADLKAGLDKEKAERIAEDNALRKRASKDRTLFTILGVVLAGGIIAK